MKIHLYNIPSVDQYVNQLISQYLGYSKDFHQGDILSADRINKLYEKSKYMLKNIDNFIKNNALDPRVMYVYAARNKLFKFIEKIKENKLVTKVNQMKESEKYQQQSFEESYQKQKSDRKQITNFNRFSSGAKSQIKPQFAKSNLTLIQQFQSQNNIQTPQNKNVPPILSYRTPSTKMKTQGPEKMDTQIKPQQNIKPKTPIKTSKKTESFTPRRIQHPKIQSSTPRRLQNQQIQSSYLKKPTDRNLVPQYRKSPISSRKQAKSIITPRGGRGIQGGEKISAKKELDSSFEPQYNRSEIKGYQYGQEQSGSTAMKNLANLIFTIKMTKEQYNEFKRIKQQNEGKMIYQQ